jgi:TRAP-type C4-dicarboxylate transport system permease small subunit
MLGFLTHTVIGGAFLLFQDFDTIPHAGVSSTADLDQMMSSKFMFFALAGSAAGAYIKIILFPPRLEDEARKMQQMAAEYFCALAGGIVLTPLSFHWWPIMPVHPISALSVSALVAVCGNLIVHIVFARATDNAKKIKQAVRDADETE